MTQTCQLNVEKTHELRLQSIGFGGTPCPNCPCPHLMWQAVAAQPPVDAWYGITRSPPKVKNLAVSYCIQNLFQRVAQGHFQMYPNARSLLNVNYFGISNCMRKKKTLVCMCETYPQSIISWIHDVDTGLHSHCEFDRTWHGIKGYNVKDGLGVFPCGGAIHGISNAIVAAVWQYGLKL